MGEWFAILGLEDLVKALTGTVEAVDQASRGAVMEAAHLVEAEAKIRSSGPARWRKGQHFPREGGPGVVTGSHRRSYHVEGPQRVGLGWQAKVGPSMIYSRAVELGHPRWKRTGGYPALSPALDTVAPRLGEVWRRHWTQALRKAGA